VSCPINHNGITGAAANPSLGLGYPKLGGEYCVAESNGLLCLPEKIGKIEGPPSVVPEIDEPSAQLKHTLSGDRKLAFIKANDAKQGPQGGVEQVPGGRHLPHVACLPHMGL